MRTKEQERKYYRDWYKKNAEASREYSRKYRHDHREQTNTASNRARIKYNYGITYDQFIQMQVSQNDSCAICNNKFKNSRDICIDHNHETGKVRQILCRRCNAFLGQVEKYGILVDKCREYSLKWSKQ